MIPSLEQGLRTNKSVRSAGIRIDASAIRGSQRGFRNRDKSRSSHDGSLDVSSRQEVSRIGVLRYLNVVCHETDLFNHIWSILSESEVLTMADDVVSITSPAHSIILINMLTNVLFLKFRRTTSTRLPSTPPSYVEPRTSVRLSGGSVRVPPLFDARERLVVETSSSELHCLLLVSRAGIP